MSINYKSENKNNEQLKLEEKNKESLSKNTKKVLGYTGLSIASVAAFGIAGKVIWDKLNKNDNNNPDQQQNNQFKKNNDDITSDVKIKQANEWEGLIRDRDIRVGNVALTPADQKYFRSYMVLPKQVNPLCWNNASIGFLASPEVRFGEEEYYQEFGHSYPDKIKTVYNWINGTIEKQKTDKNLTIEDYFEQKIKVDVPENVRPIPDGKESKLKSNKAEAFIFYEPDYGTKSVCGDITYGKFNDVDFINEITNVEDLEEGSYVVPTGEVYQYGCDMFGRIFRTVSGRCITINDIYSKLSKVKNKNKSCTLQLWVQLMKNDELGQVMFSSSRSGFYPTFIAFKASRGIDHYSVFYMIYDGNKNLKYAIWGDGSSPKGFQVLTCDELIDKIIHESYNILEGKINAPVFVRYSPARIVEKYYTPELMFNN